MSPYRSSRHVVTIAAIAATFLLWLGSALWLRNDRDATLEAARDELARMSVSATEHVNRLFSLSDLFLESIEPLAARDATLSGDPALIARISNLIRQDAVLIGLALIDHQNRLRLINQPPGSTAVDVGGRLYTEEAQTGRIIASAPVKSRVSDHWVLPLVRRVALPTSQTAFLVAGIDIAGLERHYDTIRRTIGGAVTLLRDDGLVLARSPSLPDNDRGRTLSGSPLFDNEISKQGREGVFEGASPIDGTLRLGTYRRIEPFNVGIAVSLSIEEALAPWRHRVWLVAGGAAAVTLAIAIGAVLILRLLAFLQAEALGLENRVRDRTRALNQLLERREQFLAGVSHELRSPLNAILGFSDALLMGIRGPVPPEQADYLRDIHRSGQHLLALVNDLLDSAAIDAGSLRLDETTFALADITEETTRLIAQAAAARAITVTTRIDPCGLTVHGDRRRLLQALLNLAVNAVKYGRQGGRVEITGALDSSGGCHLTVADDGEGISPENLRLALAPYGRIEHRAAASRGRPDEGTGLGLPLSIGIVDLHGGALTLHSQPGQGTRAVIRLPRERTRPTAWRTDAGSGPAAEAVANLPVQAT